MKAAQQFARIDISRLIRQSGELLILLVLCVAFVGGAAAGSSLSSGEFSSAENVLSSSGEI